MKISEIPLGEYLMFGRYQRERIVWRKVTELNGFLVVNGIYGMMADAPEPESANNALRTRGSNFFPQTNICVLLNSEERDWYKPQHDTDAVDEPAKRCFSGFLYNFESWEQELIVPQEITTIVPNGFKHRFGEQFKTSVKVSIPSASQIGQREDETEGAPFQYYRVHSTPPIGMLTRTPVGTGMYSIGTKFNLVNTSPCKTTGIFPYILIDPNAEVDYVPQDANYIVYPSQTYTREVIDELHQILK